MKKLSAFFCTIAYILFWWLNAYAVCQTTGTGKVYDYTLQKSAYTGSEARQYKVYVPLSYDSSNPVPMVFALHGCSMDHEDVRCCWNWDLAADNYNFIVVFPFLTKWIEMRIQNCWGYWFDTHIHEGKGEVEDLHRMALEVEKKYKIDQERRYIIGLSSGGGMAVASAIAYNEYWAAGASAEGLPYGDWANTVTGEECKKLVDIVKAIEAELDNPRKIPFMAIQSEKDEVVPICAANLIRDSHMKVFGGIYDTKKEEDCTFEGIPCTHIKYSDDKGKTVVETVFYKGDVPGDICGNAGCGHYYVGEDACHDAWAYEKGPKATQIFWDFFSRNTFSGNRKPEITATFEVLGSKIQAKGSATDPDGTVVSVNVIIKKRVGTDYQDFKVIPVSGDFGSFSVTSQELPDGIYKIHAEATDNNNATGRSDLKIMCINIICKKPEVANVKIDVVNNDAKVTGNVKDDDLDFIDVTASKRGETEIIKKEKAKVTKVNGDSYSFEATLKDMKEGDYTAVASAYDKLEQTGCGNKDFTIECILPASATGTIQAHCEAGRIQWSEFSHYSLKYCQDPFTVYQWPDGTWREQKFGCGGSACVTANLSKHVSEGRAYEKSIGMWWWTTKTYYAKGSNDVLGNYSMANASLLETEPGYWKKVDFCP